MIKERMRRKINMVFFFSATGNSLYVAKHLDSKPISIPQIMRKATLSFKDETIGIVCPIYGSEPPYMVQDFFKKSEIRYKIFLYGDDLWMQ